MACDWHKNGIYMSVTKMALNRLNRNFNVETLILKYSSFYISKVDLWSIPLLLVSSSYFEFIFQWWFFVFQRYQIVKFLSKLRALVFISKTAPTISGVQCVGGSSGQPKSRDTIEKWNACVVWLQIRFGAPLRNICAIICIKRTKYEKVITAGGHW